MDLRKQSKEKNLVIPSIYGEVKKMIKIGLVYLINKN